MQAFKTDKIFIYPIKSIGFVKQSEIILGKKGLMYDRNWMLVHPDGNFISQREFPQLNKVLCSDLGDQFKLELSDQSFSSISFNKTDAFYDSIPVTLWKMQFLAKLTQIELNKWFSDFLGATIKIVGEPQRIKDALVDGQIAKIDLTFQDGYPIHLINLSSIKDLEDRCGYPLDPMQFRANIYLDFGSPYIEDEIKFIMINNKKFQLIKRCERCIMVNLKPNSDLFEKEPLQTLSHYRKRNNNVEFGVYLKACE